MKILILIFIFFTHTLLYSNEESPVKFLGNVIEKSKPALIKKNTAYLEETMKKYIDFNEISLWVAGKNIWLNAEVDEKIAFENELKKLMLKTYSKTVYYYVDADVTFLMPKGGNISMNDKKRVQISSVMRKNNKNVNITYRLIKHDSSWFVFDVMIEGISILKSLMTQYSDMIRKNGLKYTTEKIRIANE